MEPKLNSLTGPIELIKKSISLFFAKENFVYFLKIYAWLVPFQLFFLYQDYFISTQSKIINTTDVQQVLFRYPVFFVAAVLINLVFILASFYIEIAGIKAVSQITNGKIESIKDVLVQSWKILWPFSLLSLLLGLIEIGGFILLIIPGIILSTWYGFSKFVFIGGGYGVVDSLKESKRLVLGRFWKVFGRSLVFTVFIVLVQMVLSVLPYGIGSIVAQFFGVLFVLPYYFLYKEVSKA